MTSVFRNTFLFPVKGIYVIIEMQKNYATLKLKIIRTHSRKFGSFRMKSPWFRLMLDRFTHGISINVLTVILVAHLLLISSLNFKDIKRRRISLQC